MEKSFPLHECHVNKVTIIINRTHAILHSIAILFLIHYRLSFFFQHPQNITIPTLPWLLIFVSELILSFAWFLQQACRWRPVYRNVFPERLPVDDKLPAIDVFICTADPKKEPSVEVMNTMISAMALDYPPEKLHVYISDDAGSDATLRCTKEAWNFAKYWVPFRRKYGLLTACPDVYFSSSEDDNGDYKGSEFKAERKKMEEKYEVLKQGLRKIVEGHFTTNVAINNTRDHPTIIEVINKEEDKVKMPQLIYVSREKRPSHNHNFKAGALNVLVHWYGFDGVGGPIISGSNFYIKREALLGSFNKQQDYMALKRLFGPSNDFIKTLVEDYKPRFIKDGESSRMSLENANILASCSYENQTVWGSKVGFLYFSVAEDYFTGLNLHRKGWKSVYLNPERQQFLGTSTTNLNDSLIQWTRWTSGPVTVALSRFCPLTYGSLKMSLVQVLCYSELAFMPLLNCLSLWGFAIIPQLCLFNGIPLYPKVSDPNFNIFSVILVSSILKSLYEVVTTGEQLKVWRNEWRIWMMRSVTCYTYGCFDVILNKLGMKEATFLPTNKVTDDEQVKLYEMGVFDFRTATVFLAPLVTVILINIAAFVGAVVKALVVDDDGDQYWEKMFGQMFLSFFILISNFAVIEGMIIRRDKAKIPLSSTLWSVVFSMFILLIGSVILC
ncbi:hypothetical protein E1A91_A09G243900v1 [Gossypium mustelinum]|uniref:Glycosyltransferase 2-like domain-containing protein n=2 Tax=Gossypium TaxID=3633 RepID=A0A5J5UJF3_GOSBA|nr:hypothetical protein ES319_A09G238800v1 [Gossypium barbadense]TYJ20169.1 hypothetical protein E1A91_A09G243900v1 [Gossypium mustelinum]